MLPVQRAFDSCRCASRISLRTDEGRKFDRINAFDKAIPGFGCNVNGRPIRRRPSAGRSCAHVLEERLVFCSRRRPASAGSSKIRSQVDQ